MRHTDFSRKILVLSAIAGGVLFSAGCATQGSAGSAQASAAKHYPLKTCIVTDEALDHDTCTFVHKGQEIKLCCDGCKGDFDKEPAKYLKKLAAK